MALAMAAGGEPDRVADDSGLARYATMVAISLGSMSR